MEAIDVRPRPRPSRTVILLLAPAGAFLVAGLVGTALAPALLVRAPLLLIALSPLVRHLALTSNSVDLVPFVAVGVTRLFASDPFLYLLGRSHGPAAVAWVASRSRWTAWLVRTLERAFVRARYVVVFVSPGPLVCLLAGAERMRPSAFVLTNLAGTLTVVVLVRLLGETLVHPLEAVRLFVATHVVLLTVVSVVLVASSMLLKVRRSRRTAASGVEVRRA